MTFDHCEKSGEGNSIHVREIENGVYHRRVIHPTDDISEEGDSVQALAAELFTDEAKAEWVTLMASEIR
jgi:hypothetical protein